MLFWETNLAKKKKKIHIGMPMYHLTSKTNGGWGFANITKLHGAKSNLSNFRVQNPNNPKL